MDTRSSVVAPDPVILNLANGRSITVKKRLNAGETRKLVSRSRYNGVEWTFASCVMYLLDWSLIGTDGKKLPIAPADEHGQSAATEASLDAIDPDDYQEIWTAIDAHEQSEKAKRAAEKKSQGGAMSASATSASHDGAGGPSTTSEVSTSTTTTLALN